MKFFKKIFNCFFKHFQHFQHRENFKIGDLVITSNGPYINYIGKIVKINNKKFVTVQFSAQTTRDEKISDLKVFKENIPIFKLNEYIKEKGNGLVCVGRVYALYKNEQIEVLWNNKKFQKLLINKIEKF